MDRRGTFSRVGFFLLAPVMFASCTSGGANSPVDPRGIPTANPGSQITTTPLTRSLQFTAVGAAAAQTFNIFDAGYTRTVSITATTCGAGASAIATISPTSAQGPSATFTVTPVNAGQCTVNVADDNNATATFTITVSALTVTPGALTFADLTTTKNLAITDQGNTAAISVSALDCVTPNPHIADFTTAFANPPASGTVTVTPVHGGICHIIVADTYGGSASITVSVPTTVNNMSANPAGLSFAGTGAAYVQNVTISDPGYAATSVLTVGGSCLSGGSPMVSVSATTITGAQLPKTIAVTPNTVGTCNLTVTDNVNDVLIIPVNVNSAGVIISGHRGR